MRRVSARAALADTSRIQAEFGSTLPQRRWTVAFRLVLLVPHLVVLVGLSTVALFGAVFGWCHALAAGRLPGAIATYLSHYVGYRTRLSAYGRLMLDRYPPFSLDTRDYPVQVEVHPVQLERMAILFRSVLLLPPNLVQLLIAIGTTAAAPVIWLVVLIAGRMPNRLFEATAATIRFSTRSQGYALMVSSAYPGELLGDASTDPPLNVPLVDPRSIDPSRWPSSRSDEIESSGSPIGRSEQTRAQAEILETSADEAVGGDIGRARLPLDEEPASPESYWSFAGPSRFVPDPSVAAIAGPRTRDQTRLQLSKGAKRIVVAFLAIGLAGYLGNLAWGVVVLRQALGARSADVNVAEAIELQPQDFPGGTAVNPGSAKTVESPSELRACSPFSGKPWIANVFSDSFSLTGSGTQAFAQDVFSQVVILSRAADASLALSSVSSPTKASACYKPSYDAATLSDYSPTKRCGSLHLVKSAIDTLRINGLEPAHVSYRYTATLQCTRSTTPLHVYFDIDNEVVGNVFITGVFAGIDNPVSTSEEEHFMSLMGSRAQLATEVSS